MAGFGAAKKRLSKKMAAVPKDVRKALRAQNKANARELVDVMRSLAPLQDGALVTSIKRKDVSNSTKIAERVSAGNREAFYASWVEFGHGDTPAHPFFWPAYRLKRRAFKSRMSRAAKKAIKAATT